MCKYCNPIDKNDEYVFGDCISDYEIDMGALPKMRIMANVIGDPGDALLHINTSMRATCCDIEVDDTSVPIHYCPMCGRKL